MIRHLGEKPFLEKNFLLKKLLLAEILNQERQTHKTHNFSSFAKLFRYGLALFLRQNFLDLTVY